MSEHGRNLTLTASDLALDLLRYYQHGQGTDYAEEVVRQVFVSEGYTPRTYLDGSGRLMHTDICAGDVYAVTSDIVDVLEQAAPSMPQFTLQESDLPSRTGFILLERPVLLHDRHGRPLILKAFGWSLAYIANLREEDIRNFTKIVGHEPPSQLIAWLAWTDPRDNRDQLNDMYEEFLRRPDFARPPGDLMSVVGGVWGIGEEVPPLGDFVPIALAFLRFIAEPWMDFRAIEPDRPRRKRAARVHRDRTPTLHVVQLRRSGTTHQRASELGGSHLDWDHRWLVRTHWRNQWYPSIQQHRPKLILEHIKGPEDKPLIIREKFFSVER